DVNDNTRLPVVSLDHTHSPSDRVAHNHFLEPLPQLIANPRKSSQSTRPSLRELDEVSLHRPKVKLGPRPSIDLNGRPRTAGSLVRAHEPRPVAALPAGLRPSSRKQSSSRPKSQPDIPVPTLPLSMAPPIPSLLIPSPPTVSVGLL